jgi:hypothetical protein
MLFRERRGSIKTERISCEGEAENRQTPHSPLRSQLFPPALEVEGYVWNWHVIQPRVSVKGSLIATVDGLTVGVDGTDPFGSSCCP